MAAQTRVTKKPARIAKPKVRRRVKAGMRSVKPGHAVSQKALLLAAKLTVPPPISDDLPSEMPFPTDIQG